MNLTQTLISALLVIGVLTVRGAEAQRKRPRGWRRSSHDPLERSSRGLVPQLMANYSGPEVTPAHEVSCAAASLACAQRDGCGSALSQYLVTCSELVSGLAPGAGCSPQCQLSLIALLSTPEGARLMECECGDSVCRDQRRRIEPCRSEVTWNTRPDTIVSCTAATWICGADSGCGTALQYYNSNCKKMFRGEKCSKRCKNSLDILLRQKAAAKLSTCYCEGTEDFECVNIRRNTDVLCFGKKPDTDILDNEIDVEEKPLKTNESWRNKGTSLIILSFLTTFAMAELGSSVSAGVLHLGRVLS